MISDAVRLERVWRRCDHASEALVVHLVADGEEHPAGCVPRGPALPYRGSLPYLARKACYHLSLRPPVAPMRVPELTFRSFSSLQERAPVLLS